jgi:ribosomal protein L19E
MIKQKYDDTESLIRLLDAKDRRWISKIKQARAEINKLLLMCKKDTDSYRAYYNSIEIVNMLIEGVEE